MLRRAISIGLAVLVHAGVLLFAFLMLLFQPEPADIVIGSVPVTVVSEIQRQAAPTPTPAEDIAEEVTPDAVETPEPEAPEPTPQPTPAPPRPQPQRPTPPRPTPSQTPEPRPERPQPRPERPTPPRPEPEELDLGALSGGQRTPTRPTRPGRPATESGSGDAPVATGQQVAVLVAQINDHWNMTFCNMAGGDNLEFRILATVDSQGRLVGAPRVENPQRGSVFQVASESAIRAIRLAAPFDVPDGFRTSVVPFRFNTRRACAAL